MKKIFSLLLIFSLFSSICFAGDWIQKPPLGVKIDWSNPITKGLVGCWLFNESGGDKVYDLSGYGNHGTLTNMAFPPTTASGWNPGKDGVGLKFDGSNDYGNCGGNVLNHISDKFTVVAQINPNATSQSTFFVGNVGVSTTGYDWGLYQHITTWKFYVETNATVSCSSGDGYSVVGQWSDVAGVYNGSQIKIYVDGVNLDTNNQSGNVDDDGYNTAFGVWKADYYFNCFLSRVFIYNRALTTQEIQELYINPYGMFKRTDVAIWKAGGWKAGGWFPTDGIGVGIGVGIFR